MWKETNCRNPVRKVRGYSIERGDFKWSCSISRRRKELVTCKKGILTYLQNSIRVGLSGCVWECSCQLWRSVLVVVRDRDRALNVASCFSELEQHDAGKLYVICSLKVECEVKWTFARCVWSDPVLFVFSVRDLASRDSNTFLDLEKSPPNWRADEVALKLCNFCRYLVNSSLPLLTHSIVARTDRILLLFSHAFFHFLGLREVCGADTQSYIVIRIPLVTRIRECRILLL